MNLVAATRRRSALRRVRTGALTMALAFGAVACSGTGSHAQPAPSTRPTVSRSALATPTCTNASVLATWTTQRLAAEVLVAPSTYTSLTQASALVKAGFGGIILFGSQAPHDLKSHIKSLLTYAVGVRPVFMADEEGGSVQRLQGLVGYVPSARYLTQTMTAAQIKAKATQIARVMAANGVYMDLAPVLDVDGRPGPNANNPDGTRSFSANPTIAARNGVAFAQGLAAGGVIATGKHFPGLGDSTGNTDVGAGHTLPWSVLQRQALPPFKAAIAAHIPVIMVANSTVPGLTTKPASVSSAVMVDVLRKQLHFTGAIITDSLSAGALRKAGYDVNAAAVASLAAGADLALFGTGSTTSPSIAIRVRDAVVTAVSKRTLTRARLIDAAGHVLAMKRVQLCAA